MTCLHLRHAEEGHALRGQGRQACQAVQGTKDQEPLGELGQVGRMTDQHRPSDGKGERLTAGQGTDTAGNFPGGVTPRPERFGRVQVDAANELAEVSQCLQNKLEEDSKLASKQAVDCPYLLKHPKVLTRYEMDYMKRCLADFSQGRTRSCQKKRD